MDERLLNDVLECSVCLERLDTSSRVLPCQHTFCIQCLREIVHRQRELRCPECRVLVETPIEELPPNVLLMRILEGMRNSGALSARCSPPPPQIIPRRPIIGPATFMEPVSSYGCTYSDKDGKHTIVVPKCTPHARALFDYSSKEPGDLSFKKGEVIILRRQIDTHWFHGETGGNQGAFPITFTKIIVSLPTIPQCTALYDFHMAAHEEEGCLAFNKGAVINVFRRVDENWAEGRLQDKIGIFPIAFVEMNDTALSLLDMSNNSNLDRNNSIATNKNASYSTPAANANKAQYKYNKTHAVHTAILSNQPGYCQQQMSVSSPTPNANELLQRQQHMSQSHPNYLQQGQLHRITENKCGMQNLLDSQGGSDCRNLQSDSLISDSQGETFNSNYSNVWTDTQCQSSSMTDFFKIVPFTNKAKVTTSKTSNLSSGYHLANNPSSESSSTTTTPSFGDSSTTPNTSSNTSSQSESNTPSSPASPTSNVNVKPNNFSIQQTSFSNKNSHCNNIGVARTLHGSSARDTSNTTITNISENALDCTVINCPSSQSNDASQSSANSSLQNNSGTISNTSPKVNSSSPQIFSTMQNNSPLAINSLSSHLDNMQLNNAQNVKYSLNTQFINSASNNLPSNVRLDHQPSSSLITLNNEKLTQDQTALVSPRHAKDSPLTNVSRTSHIHHRDREKRNSLTPGGQAISHHTTFNRHSAEILGPPTNLFEQDLNSDLSASKYIDKEKRKDTTEKDSTSNGKVKEKDKCRKPLTNNPKQPPIPYVALYAYKPQKSDELELKKGGIYMVIEQCQDGWYKGCSKRTQKCGVFPGNYVIPAAKVHQISAASSSKVTHQSASAKQSSDEILRNAGTSKSSKDFSNVTSHNKNRGIVDLISTSQIQTQPPDLPPRAPSPNSFNTNVSQIFIWSSSPKCSKSNDKSKDKNKSDKNINSGVSLMKRLTGMKKSRSPPPNHSAAFSMDNPVFEDCVSENQNPVSAIQSVNQQNIHIRSGSCPSQLLQGVSVPPSGAPNSQMKTLPHHQNCDAFVHDNTTFGNQSIGGSVSSAVAHRLFSPHHLVKGIGSQTIGPSYGPVQRRQQRPTVLNTLQGTPDSGVSLSNNFVKQGLNIGRPGDASRVPASTRYHHHRKSHSLDAGQQLKSGKENVGQTINKRFRCIVAYPPNSEYELELQVDDVVLVHKQWGEGWYKGTHERTGHTGLVPASFVESC